MKLTFEVKRLSKWLEVEEIGKGFPCLSFFFFVFRVWTQAFVCKRKVIAKVCSFLVPNGVINVFSAPIV